MRDYTEGTVLANATIRARSSANGHMLLVGKRYLTVEDGHEQVTALVEPAELDWALSHILSGHRQPDAGRSSSACPRTAGTS